MQNKTEQTAVPSEFHLFCRREKPRNSVPNHFSEEKNLVIPFQTISQKRKPSEFCSTTFLGREKPTEFRSELFLGRNPRNCVRTIFG
jgi:hypothetical protein